MSFDPIERAVDLFYSSKKRRSDDTGYDIGAPRSPSDSNLSWEFDTGRDERILRRYPPKLLDRAAIAVSAGAEIYQSKILEKEFDYAEDPEIKVEVTAKDNSLFLTIQDGFGFSGIEASLDGDGVYFEEHEGGLNQGPEREGKAYLGHIRGADSYDKFLEGLKLDQDYLVVQ